MDVIRSAAADKQTNLILRLRADGYSTAEQPLVVYPEHEEKLTLHPEAWSARRKRALCCWSAPHLLWRAELTAGLEFTRRARLSHLVLVGAMRALRDIRRNRQCTTPPARYF